MNNPPITNEDRQRLRRFCHQVLLSWIIGVPLILYYVHLLRYGK